jgi:hypothetical protein
MKIIYTFIRRIHPPRPSPPRLPRRDQEVFEESVKRATQPTTNGDIHPDARQPMRPDFEGDVNPVTGEQGGPKQEPLRHGDWSYGGRATDF